MRFVLACHTSMSELPFTIFDVVHQCALLYVCASINVYM